MEFESQLRYEGMGSAEFGAPTIRCEGPTTVTIDEAGDVTARMRVTEVPTSKSFADGVFSLSRDFFTGITSRTSSCSLQVDCGGGLFSATEQVSRSHEISLCETSASVEFKCRRAKLERANATAAYFRLPIWNFLGKLRPPHWPEKVCHDLRLSKETPANPFEAFGGDGFIENVPGFEKIAGEINSSRHPRVTAVLVGRV